MTEYEKLELLHSQLDELIQGNQLPIDELKILQSFIEDIRERLRLYYKTKKSVYLTLFFP